MIIYYSHVGSEPRPPIPEGMKREIRQRCGFGCVICGFPIYEYDHMDGYHNTGHITDRITLLCPMHHAEKTKGLRTTSDVKRWNSLPYNVARGVSSPYGLQFSGDTFNVAIGSCLFEAARARLVPLAVKDKELISVRFEEGNLFLNAAIPDQSGDICLIIQDNELKYSTGLWDVEFVGKTLTLRSASGAILLEASFIPPSSMHIRRMNVHVEDVLVRADRRNGIRIDTPKFKNGGFNDVTYRNMTYCVAVSSPSLRGTAGVFVA